jgi:hypothetical protein
MTGTPIVIRVKAILASGAAHDAIVKAVEIAELEHEVEFKWRGYAP